MKFKIGDHVSYKSVVTGKVIECIIISQVTHKNRDYLQVRLFNGLVRYLEPKYVVGYEIRPNDTSNTVCSCGAKYTSNPNFHLNFCDIK